MSKVYTLEEIESELLGGMIHREAAERDGWRFTVYSGSHKDEVSVQARKGARLRFRVVSLGEDSPFEFGPKPVTGRKGLELVEKLENYLGGPFPWV